MRLFTVPYDSGHHALRMGGGPLRLRALIPQLNAEEIHPRGEFRAEIATTFDLYRILAERVAAANDAVIVLSGNCGACVGTAAGLGTDDLGVIWFDAHGDYMTPDTSTTGFLDGMGMSIVAGRCFDRLAASIPGFSPLPPERTIHMGGRDWSDGELEALHADGVSVVAPGEDPSPALDRIKARRMIVHIDLDVISSEYGHANGYAVGGGMSPQELSRAVDLVRDRFDVAALELASYDPACDADGRIAAAAAQILAKFC